MVEVLGVKRIMVLALLVVLNGLFVAGAYQYIEPEKAKKERDLKRVRAQVSTLQSDIERMQIEFDQLEEQQEEFDVLKEQGFFSNQGRRQAEIIFERIQDEARVISAVVSVQAGTVEANEEAGKAEHKVLKSPIKIRIEAMEDIDIFRYIYLVEKFFPGHVAVESIDIERQAEITGTVLRSIASGNNPELVQADIEMMWRTMIPDTAVIEGGER